MTNKTIFQLVFIFVLSIPLSCFAYTNDISPDQEFSFSSSTNICQFIYLPQGVKCSFKNYKVEIKSIFVLDESVLLTSEEENKKLRAIREGCGKSYIPAGYECVVLSDYSVKVLSISEIIKRKANEKSSVQWRNRCQGIRLPADYLCTVFSQSELIFTRKVNQNVFSHFNHFKDDESYLFKPDKNNRHDFEPTYKRFERREEFIKSLRNNISNQNEFNKTHDIYQWVSLGKIVVATSKITAKTIAALAVSTEVPPLLFVAGPRIYKEAKQFARDAIEIKRQLKSMRVHEDYLKRRNAELLEQIKKNEQAQEKSQTNNKN